MIGKIISAAAVFTAAAGVTAMKKEKTFAPYAR